MKKFWTSLTAIFHQAPLGTKIMMIVADIGLIMALLPTTTLLGLILSFFAVAWSIISLIRRKKHKTDTSRAAAIALIISLIGAGIGYTPVPRPRPIPAQIVLPLIVQMTKILHPAPLILRIRQILKMIPIMILILIIILIPTTTRIRMMTQTPTLPQPPHHQKK